MANKEHIGKILRWSSNPGEGWIRTRISSEQIVEWRFTGSTKQTGYQPVTGDRIAFIVKRNREGLEYAARITFIQTGN